MYTTNHDLLLEGAYTYTTMSGLIDYLGNSCQYNPTKDEKNILGFMFYKTMFIHPHGLNQISGMGYPCIIFGSGTTEPTKDDFMLESGFETTDATFSYSGYKATRVDNKLLMEATFTLTNNRSEEMTVGEWGLITLTHEQRYVLIKRETLKQPLKVLPGDSCTIKITFDITLP